MELVLPGRPQRPRWNRLCTARDCRRYNSTGMYNKSSIGTPSLGVPVCGAHLGWVKEYVFFWCCFWDVGPELGSFLASPFWFGPSPIVLSFPPLPSVATSPTGCPQGTKKKRGKKNCGQLVDRMMKARAFRARGYLGCRQQNWQLFSPNSNPHSGIRYQSRYGAGGVRSRKPPS